MKKRIMKTVLIFIAIALLYACDENENYYYDNTPPSPPKNINTITGDGRVDIYWDSNRESDLSGYNVYYAYSYDGKYTLLGNTEDTYFVDYGAENGETYYYAVAAYDYNGNESDLSYDVVHDTPRPEGFNEAIFDYIRFPSNSGYDFSEFLVTAYDSDGADFFFENYEGTLYLNVWEDTDIQDMGETEDIYDIDEAPLDGWVPLISGDNVKYVEVEIGHTYVVWTWDNHFAKIRVTYATGERVVFDWAYQLQSGNPELKRTAQSGKRKELPGEVIIDSRSN